MAFKTNYRFERAERARKKEIRKLEKLEAKEARRKAKASDPAQGGEPDGAELPKEQD
ncbi:MAG: hypothetical protein NBV67_18135 [Tagaea sp.]|nr:hypothetical protein [Tagaea sp.]